MVGKKRKDLLSGSSDWTWHPNLSAGMQADCPAGDGGSLVVGPLGSLGITLTLLFFSRTDQPSQFGEDRSDNSGDTHSRGAPREPQSRLGGPLSWPSITATTFNLKRPADMSIRIKFVPAQSCWGDRL